LKTFPHPILTHEVHFIHFSKKEYKKQISRKFAKKSSNIKILFELDGIQTNIAKEAFRLGSAKLPIKTDVIERVIK
jgi:hypothetical protein